MKARERGEKEGKREVKSVRMVLFTTQNNTSEDAREYLSTVLCINHLFVMSFNPGDFTFLQTQRATRE